MLHFYGELTNYLSVIMTHFNMATANVLIFHFYRLTCQQTTKHLYGRKYDKNIGARTKRFIH